MPLKMTRFTMREWALIDNYPLKAEILFRFLEVCRRKFDPILAKLQVLLVVRIVVDVLLTA